MKKDKTPLPLDADSVAALDHGRHSDPFSVLGPHKHGRATWLTVLDQGADKMAAVIGSKSYPLERVDGIVFCGKVPGNKPYTLRGQGVDGTTWEYEDAYLFGPVISALDEYLLGEGTHHQLWKALGAHVMAHEGAAGTHFAVWAPNAQRVSVVGEFNAWDGRRHVMRRRGGTGVWEIFIPGIADGAAYKYELIGPQGELLPQKADPIGFGAQHPPETASVVRDIAGYGWDDSAWMSSRGECAIG